MKTPTKSWRIEKWNDHGRTVVSIRDNKKTLAVVSAQLDGSEEEIARAILQTAK